MPNEAFRLDTIAVSSHLPASVMKLVQRPSPPYSAPCNSFATYPRSRSALFLQVFAFSTHTLADMQATALMSKPVAVQTRISRPSAIRSFRAPAAPVVARRNFVVRAEVCCFSFRSSLVPCRYSCCTIVSGWCAHAADHHFSFICQLSSACA